MPYFVKEIFYSIQGEGHYSGHPAVFCRFSGCNLWDGRPTTKQKSKCVFCDTDFVGGQKMDEDTLVNAILSHWPGINGCPPRVVLTGGEPTLQITDSLIKKLKGAHTNVHIETNGTREIRTMRPVWVTVSPKCLDSLVVLKGNELKLLYPLPTVTPGDVEHLDFRYFYLQPIDNENAAENLSGAIAYCLRNPKWNLSTQGHKQWGVL